MKPIPNLAVIEAMDVVDPLRSVRERFVLPDGLVYLDGNSLGAASPNALRELDKAAREEWGEGLIRSWNTAGWFDLPIDLGDRIGCLIGAAPGQTVVCDTTSINIYKALHAALGLRPDRSVIVAESSSFPTDLYMAEGVLSTLPRTSLLLEGVNAARIEDLIDESTAVVLINHVDYRSGALRDMAALTRRAHEVGALVVWDLCHSAGVLPVELDGTQADFAVGCTYKYLNGGPGSPAFIYVAKRHQADARQPLSGWWGHARPFAFEQRFQGDSGIRKFQCGTQPVLSLRALAGALDVWEDVDIRAVREKSIALTDVFIRLVEGRCAGFGLTLQTPRDGEWRGSQVSFSHDHAYEIMQALIARGVIGDFRAPDIMRFGFMPLYTSHRDVWRAAEALEEVLRSEAWQDARYAVRTSVT